MKKIIKNLETESEKLLEIIQTREDKVDEMSERWQFSQKCDDWCHKTQEIKDQVKKLELAVDILSDFI